MPTFAVRETKETKTPTVKVEPPHPPGASMQFELIVVDELDGTSARATIAIQVARG